MSGTVETAYVDVGGIRTRYLVAGEGPPVVLLHGTSLAIDARATWYRTIPALASRFRVYAPDMPGFGGTDPAPHGRHMLRMERSGFARAFLDSLEIERCGLVGHSEGGFLGTRIAIEQPDRVLALAIVASGATSPRLGSTADDEWQAASAAVYDVRGGCGSEGDFIRTISAMSVTNPPEYLDLLRENYRKAISGGQRDRLIAAASESGYADYTQLQEEEIFPHLPGFATRVALIWPADDPTIPVARALGLYAMLPGADLHILSRAAHMVMIDRTEAFNATLLQFLAKE